MILKPYCDNAYTPPSLWPRPGSSDWDFLAECKRAGIQILCYVASNIKGYILVQVLVALATSHNNLWGHKEAVEDGDNRTWQNQLRHVRYFKDIHGMVVEHVKKHANSLRPKLEMVLDTLESRAYALGIASWQSRRPWHTSSHHRQLITPWSTCKRSGIIKCKKAGVALTGAGAIRAETTLRQEYLRIAPSFPPVGDLDGTGQ